MSRGEAGQSDWEDQDLLTNTLAAERLAAEISALRSGIAQGEASDAADPSGSRARLAQLVEAAERLARRSGERPRP